MSEEELKKWFWNKFSLCYPVQHKDYPYKIFYFYDENFLRKTKLCRLNNQELLLPSKVNGICLFEINIDTNYFTCHYDEIWEFMYFNYSDNYLDIQLLITRWLRENKNMGKFIPFARKWVHDALFDMNDLRVSTTMLWYENKNNFYDIKKVTFF